MAAQGDQITRDASLQDLATPGVVVSPTHSGLLIV